MNEEYRIEYVEKPEEAAWGIIGRGLHEYNIAQAGDNKFQRLCFVLRDAKEEIVGGILGELYWEWFYVDLMWVREDLRQYGHGRRLLTHAEDEARRRGASHVYLDTFSFQAPDFYQKNGYEIFGELTDYPPGHRRFFFTKQL